MANIIEKLTLLIKTSRPLGWIVAPLSFLIGLSYADAKVNILPIIQIILLSFPYCIFLYGINDVYDYESDKINPRKNTIEGIILKPKYHQFVKKVSFFVVLSLIISSFITLNTTNIFGMLLLVFFSYYYSAPPLRFKLNPPLGSFANGILYFFSPFLIGFSFGKDISEIDIKTILVASCVMGIHSFSTVMDYSVDKKIGDKTIAVVLGKRAASFLAFVIFILTQHFAKIEIAVVNYYLIFNSLLFLIVSIFPSEKLASLFFKLIFIGFIITAIIFLFEVPTIF